MGIFDEEKAAPVMAFDDPPTRFMLSEEDREEVRIQAKEYSELQAEVSEKAKRATFLKKQILSRFPPEPSTYLMETPKGTIEVSISEVIEFDIDELEKLVDPADLPPFVRLRPKVDAKLFQALPSSVRDKYASVVTRKPSRHTIKYTEA